MVDELISLRDAAKLGWLPKRRHGSRLSFCTIWRWVLCGVKAKDGSQLKLKAIRVGNCLCTTEAWLREFFDCLTAHDPALVLDRSPRSRTITQQRRASERAEKELEQMGI